MATTHDLPTIHGWWQERDIHWKTLLDSITPVHLDKVRAERASERVELWRALEREGYVPPGAGDAPDDTPLNAIMSFVAGTPSPLALFSLEDLLGMLDQPNMPGTVTGQGLISHPNWVQLLPESIETMFADTTVAGRLEAVRQARSAS